jgi:hypothetical protein
MRLAIGERLVIVGFDDEVYAARVSAGAWDNGER